MISENPFILERSNKKFFMGLSRPSENLPDQRDIQDPFVRLHLSTDKAKNYSRMKRLEQQYSVNKQLSLIKQQSDRLKNTIKQRRETVKEFIKKKKQIFWSKLNISLKQSAIKVNQSNINDQVQAILARKAFFKNDLALIGKLKDSIKQAASNAKSIAQSQKKYQHQLQEEQNKIQTQLEKLKISIDRAESERDILKGYKTFIDQFIIKDIILRVNQEDAKAKGFYMTQNPQLQLNKKYFYPKDLVQIFDLMVEGNLLLIQSNYDAKQEMQKIKKALDAQKHLNQKNNKDFSQKFKTLHLVKQSLLKRRHKLEESSKLRQNKTYNSDNGQLDMGLISDKIRELYKQMFNKTPVTHSHSQLKELLKEIQIKITSELADLKQSPPKKKRVKMFQDVEVVTKVQRRLKRQQKRVAQGRKDMGKLLIERKVKQVQEVQREAVDETSKYFQD